MYGITEDDIRRFILTGLKPGEKSDASDDIEFNESEPVDEEPVDRTLEDNEWFERELAEREKQYQADCRCEQLNKIASDYPSFDISRVSDDEPMESVRRRAQFDNDYFDYY